MLFLSPFLFGLFGAQKLKKRADCLLDIRLAVEKIKNQIRSGNDDFFFAFNNAFCDIDSIEIIDKKLRFANNLLLKEDKDIIFELFGALGTSDIKGECEKIEIYDGIIEKQYLSAKCEYEQKGKIYKTFGFCVGLGLVIFSL